jgi:hypothetical protein
MKGSGTMNIILNERSHARTSYRRCLPLLLLLTALTTLLRAQTVTTQIPVGKRTNTGPYRPYR